MKFKSDIEVQAGLKDSSGSAGTSEQILSSTASGVSWINQISLSGYVPYTGATTNVDLGTHTLLANDLVINHSSGSGVAASITKGGNGEALTINKTSGSGNAMSVTGGLTSLVDLTLSSIANATTDTDKFIVSDSGLIKYRTGAEVLSDIGGQAALTNPITGTGTTNYVSKFTGTTTLGNSQIFDNGTNVGIGTSSPSSKLTVVSSTNTILKLKGGTSSNQGSAFYIERANSTSTLFAIGDSSSITGGTPDSLSTVFSSTPLNFYINGSERMRIASSGNVGIGNTNPTAIGTNITTLDIKGSTGGGIRSGVLGGSESTFYTIAAGGYLGTISNIPLNFQTNNSVKATILANGNFGIGTTNPDTLLHISSLNSSILRLESTNTALGLDAVVGEIQFEANDASGTGTGVKAKIGAYSDVAAGNAVGLRFFTGEAGVATATEKMRIAATGNVGIGTTNPTALLTVSGDALINSITVGRGAGNDASNTVIGRDAFVNNLSGQQNTVIGYSAGANLTLGGSNVFVGQSAGINVNSGSGNTIIGTLNSFPPTGAPADFSDTLSISKGESNFGVYLPHIWAPANVATSSTATIISAAVGSYRAMFVEYVIEDEDGNIRGGYIKGIWNSDLSVIKMTEDTTSSIGTTSNYVFDIVDDGSSNAALQITSLSTDIVYCAVTSRLLTRVY